MHTSKTRALIAAALIAACGILAVFARPALAQLRAALVKDIDHPARQPFAAGAFPSVSGGASVSETFLTVPAGKRGVIEHVSCIISLDPSNNFVRIQVDVTTNGNVNSHQFLPSHVGPSIGGLENWAFSQPVRLYADPGTDVELRVSRRLASSSGGVECYVSGHYVDLP
jgi:hypothetical protein